MCTCNTFLHRKSLSPYGLSRYPFIRHLDLSKNCIKEIGDSRFGVTVAPPVLQFIAIWYHCLNSVSSSGQLWQDIRPISALRHVLSLNLAHSRHVYLNLAGTCWHILVKTQRKDDAEMQVIQDGNSFKGEVRNAQPNNSNLLSCTWALYGINMEWALCESPADNAQVQQDLQYGLGSRGNQKGLNNVAEQSFSCSEGVHFCFRLTSDTSVQKAKKCSTNFWLDCDYTIKHYNCNQLHVWIMYLNY